MTIFLMSLWWRCKSADRGSVFRGVRGFIMSHPIYSSVPESQSQGSVMVVNGRVSVCAYYAPRDGDRSGSFFIELVWEGGRWSGYVNNARESQILDELFPGIGSGGQGRQDRVVGSETYLQILCEPFVKSNGRQGYNILRMGVCVTANQVITGRAEQDPKSKSK
jgi:hypothetical protein